MLGLHRLEEPTRERHDVWSVSMFQTRFPIGTDDEVVLNFRPLAPVVYIGAWGVQKMDGASLTCMMVAANPHSNPEHPREIDFKMLTVFLRGEIVVMDVDEWARIFSHSTSQT